MEVQTREESTTATSRLKIPDPFDYVYSNMPNETHMLKSIENCEFCNAKKFEYEHNGL